MAIGIKIVYLQPQDMEAEESPEIPLTLASGCLYVVATPIGNLDDMSARAIDTLRSVQTILAEDTRSFKVLAARYGILTPVISYHDHNEQGRTESLLPQLKGGASMALVSEAGTPGISDPGYRIVRACREAGVPVRGVPGAAAFLTALSVSGFEIDAFAFYGFLPQRPGKRRRTLEAILERPLTSVLYESPYKILSVVELIAEIQPTRELFVARELTKKFEEHLSGTAIEVAKKLGAAKIRGEFVVVIRRASESEAAETPEE